MLGCDRTAVCVSCLPSWIPRRLRAETVGPTGTWSLGPVRQQARRRDTGGPGAYALTLHVGAGALCEPAPVKADK